MPPPPRTVLDVGGSTGVVAGAVRDAFGVTATVLDPAPDGARRGRGGRDGHDRRASPRTCRSASGPGTWSCSARPSTTCSTCGARSLPILLPRRDRRPCLRRRARPGVPAARGEGHDRGGGQGRPSLLPVPGHGRVRTSVQAGSPPIAAERMSDDGHWGFLLAPADPARARLGGRSERAPTAFSRAGSGAGAPAADRARPRPGAGARRVQERTPRKNLARARRAARWCAVPSTHRCRAAPLADVVSLSSDDDEILARGRGPAGRRPAARPAELAPRTGPWRTTWPCTRST